MTTETTPPEPQKRNLVAEFITAAAFGLPPEACRKVEKSSPETDQNLVNEFVKASGFGLAKRGD